MKIHYFIYYPTHIQYTMKYNIIKYIIYKVNLKNVKFLTFISKIKQHFTN